jgi:transposase
VARFVESAIGGGRCLLRHVMF